MVFCEFSYNLSPVAGIMRRNEEKPGMAFPGTNLTLSVEDVHVVRVNASARKPYLIG